MLYKEVYTEALEESYNCMRRELKEIPVLHTVNLMNIMHNIAIYTQCAV